MALNFRWVGDASAKAAAELEQLRGALAEKVGRLEVVEAENHRLTAENEVGGRKLAALEHTVAAVESARSTAASVCANCPEANLEGGCSG